MAIKTWHAGMSNLRGLLVVPGDSGGSRGQIRYTMPHSRAAFAAKVSPVDHTSYIINLIGIDRHLALIMVLL